MVQHIKIALFAACNFFFQLSLYNNKSMFDQSFHASFTQPVQQTTYAQFHFYATCAIACTKAKPHVVSYYLVRVVRT